MVFVPTKSIEFSVIIHLEWIILFCFLAIHFVGVDSGMFICIRLFIKRYQKFPLFIYIYWIKNY